MTRLALLFDLDGTLIDSIDLLLQCMNFAFEGATRAPSRDEWIAGIGIPLRTQLASWADDDAAVEALVGRYRDYQDLHLERLTNAYDGVPELLAWAKERGHGVGLVTSKGLGMTARSLSHVGIEKCFDAVVTVESTSRHKPEPEPVLHALEQLGADAGRALFVGDSPHDMESGRRAGVQTVACLWGPYSHEQLATAEPTFWAREIADLYPVISRLENGT